MAQLQEVTVDDLKHLVSGRAIEGETMLLNMGPQHPATHGVFRMVLVVDGELVTDLVSHIGYMHRGGEKLSENMDYRQAIGYLVEAAGKAERCGATETASSYYELAEEEIDAAVDQPPQTTRARLRGEFIRTAKEKRRDYTVDWVHLKLNDQAQRTVLCKDPFKSQDDRVDRLIAGL